MARSTKAAVLDEELDTTEEVAEATPKQIINAGIDRVVEIGGDAQHARYKAMRAIAFQAFLEAIESDDFDGLVDRAIAGVPDLPSGWELERAPKEDEAPAKAPVKRAAAKAPAAKATPAKRTPAAKATPAKTPARRRPARSAE